MLDEEDRYRAQTRAHAAVAKAVAAGDLPSITTLPCFDCKDSPAAAYHHYMGYASESHLDVVALCDRCHARRHLPDRRPRKARYVPGETTMLSVRVSTSLHATLKAIAQEQHRSVSSLIAFAAQRYADGWPAEREREEEEARPYYADLRDDDDPT
jgi:hypothetical protein